jgi:hypothetical protein
LHVKRPSGASQARQRLVSLLFSRLRSPSAPLFGGRIRHHLHHSVGFCLRQGNVDGPMIFLSSAIIAAMAADHTLKFKLITFYVGDKDDSNRPGARSLRQKLSF